MPYFFKPLQSLPNHVNSRDTTHFYKKTAFPPKKPVSLITVGVNHTYDEFGCPRPQHPARSKTPLPIGAIPDSWHEDRESKKRASILEVYDQLSTFITKKQNLAGATGVIKFIAGEFDEESRTENDLSIKLTAEEINRDRPGVNTFLNLRANAITVPRKSGSAYALSCVYEVVTARPESGLKVNQRICGSAHISPELGDKIINGTVLTPDDKDSLSRSIRESMQNAVIVKIGKLRQVAITPYRAGSGTGGQSSIVIT